jgi:hypothetical protein
MRASLYSLAGLLQRLGISTTAGAGKVPQADSSGNISMDFVPEGAAHTILRTPSPAATPTWLAMGTDSVLVRTSDIGTTVQALAVGSNGLICRVGTNALGALSLSSARWFGRTSGGSLSGNTFAEMWGELRASFAGTSFPGSPVDGDPFYRTDLGWGFHYDGTAAGWLGDAVHEIIGGDAAATAISTYYRELPVGASANRYSATYGRQFGFDVKCVGLTILSATTPATSAVAEVHDDGAAVTGASLTLTNPATSVQSETLMSSTIAAGSIVGLYNNATGATAAGSTLVARFRRFLT